MKNILLGTDFSSNAHTAALCAGEIAKRMGGRLIILHALPPLAMLKNGDYANEDDQCEAIAQKKLDALAKELHNRFGISVSRLLKPGFAEDEIPTIGQNLKAKLTVIGARGKSPEPNRVSGSIAKELLIKSTLPLICVPSEELMPISSQLSLIVNNQPQLCNMGGLEFLNELLRKFSSDEIMPKKRAV